MLCIHREGSCKTTESAVRAVPVPKSTATWFPLGYARLLDSTYKALDRAKIKVVAKEFGLTAKNAQFFATMDLSAPGLDNKEYRMQLGLRGSIDQSLADQALIGQRVFVCDNMAWVGDQTILRRKNTAFIERDIPVLFDRIVEHLPAAKKQADEFHNRLREFPIAEDGNAYDTIVRAAKNEVITSSQIIPVAEMWDDPTRVCETPKELEGFRTQFGDRNMWRLWNAFTFVLKGTKITNAVTHSNRTRLLTDFITAELAANN